MAATITKTMHGWSATGSTIEELVLAARAIDALDLPRVPIVAEKVTKCKTSDRIRNFLVANGPMRRGDVIKYSGIPAGTINSRNGLNTKNFVQLSDGRWSGEPLVPT